MIYSFLFEHFWIDYWLIIMFHNDADSTQSIERMCILYTLTSTDLSTCTDTNRQIFFFLPVNLFPAKVLIF